MRARFLLFTPTTPGGPKSTPFWSKIEAKSLPGAAQVASKAVSKKGIISVPISDPIFMIFQSPRGGARGPPMALKSVPRCFWLAGSRANLLRQRNAPFWPPKTIDVGPIWARFWSSILELDPLVFTGRGGLYHPPPPRGGGKPLLGPSWGLPGPQEAILQEVYISGHDFCHTFRWYENEGRAWNALGGIHFWS